MIQVKEDLAVKGHNATIQVACKIVACFVLLLEFPNIWKNQDAFACYIYVCFSSKYSVRYRWYSFYSRNQKGHCEGWQWTNSSTSFFLSFRGMYSVILQESLVGPLIIHKLCSVSNTGFFELQIAEFCSCTATAPETTVQKSTQVVILANLLYHAVTCFESLKGRRFVCERVHFS